MTPDIVVMVICIVSGTLLGGAITGLIMTGFAHHAAVAAHKKAWREAAWFYGRKEGR